MKIRSLVDRRCLMALVITAAVLPNPSVALAQDLGGIAGALIGGAINAQRMQQYRNQQRHNSEPRRHSKGDSEEQTRAADKKVEASKQKQEAFEKIASAAKDLIEDASAFVKESPSNPKLVEFIKKISKLNTAIAARDAAKIQPLMESLVADLHREAGYGKIEAARSEKRRLEAEHYLPELTKMTKQQQAFIRFFITNNPTSPNTETFISLLAEIDVTLATPDVEKLRALTSKVDVSIRQAGLQDDFYKSTIVLNNQTPQSPPDNKIGAAVVDDGLQNPVERPTSVLRKTSKNAFLIDGDPKDLVLMFNSSPQAPHVTINLSGGIEFDNSAAKTCLYQPNFAKSLIYILRQNLLKYRLNNIEIDSSECSRSNLLTYDLIAVERGEFAKLSPEVSMALYSELEMGRFKSLETITSAQLAQIPAEQAKLRSRNEGYIEGGLEPGYGIVFAGPQVDSFCMVVKDKEKAHRTTLLDNIEQLTFEFGSKEPVPLLKANLEEAYKAFQHRECQAIYSSASELKNVLSALKRNDVSYSVSSVWITEDQVLAADKAIEEAENRAKQEQQAYLTKLETDKKLKESLQKEEMATAKKRQEALQAQYGKVATASAADIANVVREVTAVRPDWQQTEAYNEFKYFSTWYQNLVQSRWELQSYNSEVYDYGQAIWKGRSMETSFVMVLIQLRNRILGEYKKACFVFARMKDTEFNMIRDTMEVNCGQARRISDWQKARNFESLWRVEMVGN
jgi:hypothetical protein